MNIFKHMKDKTFAEIAELLKLNMKQDSDYTLLKYQQTNSQMSNKTVRECRGIVFETYTQKLVSLPFEKFDNLKDQDKIDFKQYTVYEKTDGSMINLWFSDIRNEWIVSTTGSLYADSPTILDGDIISKMFWDTVEHVKMNIDALQKGYTYVFELATKQNVVVNTYDESTLKLLLVRDMSTLKEQRIDQHAKDLNVDKPTSYTFDSVQSMKDSLSNVKKGDVNFEGYVLVDENSDAQSFPRFKVKSNTYIVHHQFKGDDINQKGFSKYRLIDVVHSNEIEEVSANFPALSELLANIESQLVEFKGMLSTAFELNRTEMDNREFYINIEKHTDIPKNKRLLKSVFTVLKNDRSVTLDNAMKSLDSKKLFKIMELNLGAQQNDD